LVHQAQLGGIDVLFVGDSITDFWIGVSNNGRTATGKAVWDANFAPLKAADFAYSADKTQNVLWRLQNGEGQGFSPKVVVLMIGTNNLGVTTRRTPASAWRGTNMEAIEGVTAVVAELRKDFPPAKILLLGIFPRGDDLLAMAQIPEVNKGLARLDDQQHVFYLDLTPKFLGPDGQINMAYFQKADHLHPSAAGYAVWAAGMKDLLAKLMQ
jgi:lysophospholipase L1-like esterase